MAAGEDNWEASYFKHSVKPKVVTVAGKLGDDVPKGTLKTILKDSGLETR